jgi:hypothetical protein
MLIVYYGLVELCDVFLFSFFFFSLLPLSTDPLNSIENNPLFAPVLRATSPVAQASTSSSSSTSSSIEASNVIQNFSFPNTDHANRNRIKKAAEIIPPTLIDFDDHDSHDDNEDDTSTSVFSKRNATPVALDRLNVIDKIIRGDETPRTRAHVDRIFMGDTQNLPVDYDDDSASQSHSVVSNVDDIAVVKKLPSMSANIDFFDDI